jgi:hypothetical protein
MGKVLYIDYENVQSVDLGRIVQMDFKIWVFTGVSQNRIPIDLVKSTQAFGNKLAWVTIDGNGPNALDFHIAYYLGVHVAENPRDEYFILSKDKGFDPLVSHVGKGNIRCRRISTVSEIESTSRASARIKKVKESDGMYSKIVANLSKIEANRRPRNRRTLLQFVKALAGKSQKELKPEQIVAQLIAARVVIDGKEGLTYKL